MKKFNAQAETHSNRVGQPRASRPRTEVFEQNDTANQVDRHALHRLLTQNDLATGTELHALHHLLTQNAQADLVPLRDVSAIFFYFLFRLQAQAHSGPAWQLQGSRT